MNHAGDLEELIPYPQLSAKDELTITMERIDKYRKCSNNPEVAIRLELAYDLIRSAKYYI